MKQESFNSVETINHLSGTTIDAVTLGPSTRFGNFILKYFELTSSKSILQLTDSNGFVALEIQASRPTPPSSPANTFAESSSLNLIGFVKKFYGSILISFSLWVTLLFGLYVAELVSANSVVLLTTLLTVLLGINSYLLITRLRSFVNGLTDPPQSST